MVPTEPPKDIYLVLDGGRLIFDNFDFIYGMFIGKSLEEAPDVLDLIFEPGFPRAFQATRSFKVKGDNLQLFLKADDLVLELYQLIR